MNKATATKRSAQRDIFTRGGNVQNKQNANREYGRFDEFEYLDD
jgi:hypothetical protein